MRINNIQTSTNNQGKVSHKGAREFVRTLANPDALTSTVLLETAVTGGRGYNAYKRGGVNELRERATDDILACREKLEAVFGDAFDSDKWGFVWPYARPVGRNPETPSYSYIQIHRL